MKATDISLTQVDQLGFLLAQIADLQAQADTIKDAIKDAGVSLEGNLFKATYTETNRKSVDTKTMFKDLNIDSVTIEKYTKTTAVFSVKVTSR